MLSVLTRNPSLRALVASRLVSSAGTWLAYVALTVDVYVRTHSSVWVSAVLLAEFLPTVAVAALFGPWLDRISRRTLLIASELAAGAVFAALPFAPSAAVVVGLALCAGFANAVFFPSARASLPLLVAEDDLPTANAVYQTAGTSGLAAGPVLAGLLVAASGVDLAYALNALSFAASAVLLSRLPTLAPGETERRRYWQTAFAGVRVFAESSVLRSVLQSWLLASLGGAVINVGEIFLARQTFHAGTVGFGLLASASGSGIVAGSVLAARIGLGGAVRACAVGATAFACGFAGAALAPSIWLAGACAFCGGVGNALFMAASTLAVQQSTEDAVRGRAFAFFDAAGSSTLAGGMAGAGLLISATGARAAWLVAAALGAIAAVGLLRHQAGVEVLRPEPEPS